MIPVVAFLAVYVALPFYRQIDATSAYEYLEKRFSLPVRLFGLRVEAHHDLDALPATQGDPRGIGGQQRVSPVTAVGGALHLVPVVVEGPHARRRVSAASSVRLDGDGEPLVSCRSFARVPLRPARRRAVAPEGDEVMQVLLVEELHVEPHEDDVGLVVGAV